MMTYRGSARGGPAGTAPAFIAFMQNHDQVGNRAFGDRLTQQARLSGCVPSPLMFLLAPQIPMLFMGEEWAAAQPFPFFCDFEPAGGSRAQGPACGVCQISGISGRGHARTDSDPTAEETFRSAKLDWRDLTRRRTRSGSTGIGGLAVRRTESCQSSLRQRVMPGCIGNLGPGAFRVRWSLC